VVQNHKQPGPRIIKLVSEFPGTLERIEENRHPTQIKGGMVSHHQLGAVGQKHSQAVAWCQAQVPKGPGQALDLLQKVTIGGDLPKKVKGREIPGTLPRLNKQSG
jgi:hypothetical protein